MWTASSKKASFEDKVWGNWIPSSLEAFFEDRLGGGGSTRPESGPNSPLIKNICGVDLACSGAKAGLGPLVILNKGPGGENGRGKLGSILI